MGGVQPYRRDNLRCIAIAEVATGKPEPPSNLSLMEVVDELREVEREIARLEHEAFRVEDAQVDWGVGFAGMLSIAAPLFVGLVVGAPQLGLFAALGGLNVALATPGHKVGDRWRWGLLGLFASASATLLGSLVAPSIVASVIAMLIWTTIWSALRIDGKQGALVGFVATAVLAITSGLKGPPPLIETLALTSGGILALCLMMVAGGGPRPPGGKPTWVPLRVTFARVRGGLANNKALRSHCLRISVTAAISVLIYRVFEVPYGYWATLAALAILQPDQYPSFVRAMQRSTGTFAGVALAALTVGVIGISFDPSDPWVLASAAALMALAMFALRDRSYHWLVMFLTPTAMLMISTLIFLGWELALHRIVNTLAGVLIALVAIILFPGPGKSAK
jgi:hypothetical protein